jgi:hypothetical protein
MYIRIMEDSLERASLSNAMRISGKCLVGLQQDGR